MTGAPGSADGRPAGESVDVRPDQSILGATDALAAAWDALGGVYDPELCLDLVSLGLVYKVADEDGTLVVEMTLTTRGCPASESMSEMARAALAETVGDTVPVEVRLVWDPPWSPAMMNDEAAGALGFRSR